MQSVYEADYVTVDLGIAGEIDFTNFTALVSGSREDDGTSFESPLARRKPKVRSCRSRRR